MDPIQTLLSFLRSALPTTNTFAPIEAKVNEIFSSFALVPKHEYEAHLQVLKTLEQQVADLETRLQQIESD